MFNEWVNGPGCGSVYSRKMLPNASHRIAELKLNDVKRLYPRFAEIVKEWLAALACVLVVPG